jgi:2-hydroxy-3-oxopropionate reductase
MQTIGYIGIGIMGKPMVKNLLNAGYAVNVYARRETSIMDLCEDRCAVYNSPQALARESDVIISCVADTSDVEQVLVGEEGVLSAVKPGITVIDMSTISPEATRAMAEQFTEAGAYMLDAPVSGGEIGAIDGSLSIMVGGKSEDFERMLPLFKCLGKNIIHVGDHGAGQVAKACNQILVAQTMNAVAEAFLLAQSSHVDAAKVREALLGGFAYSKILEVHGQRMLDSSYQPGFKACLHAKDLRIASESAKATGCSLPGADLVAAYMNTLVEQGDGDLDSAAIAKIIGSG